MYVMVAVEAGDIYYPPGYNIDDVPGWLAEIMTESGIKGSFLVRGEKARSLREHGKKEVIEKISCHDIVSFQQGNCHPLIPEILEDKDWGAGLDAMREFEDRVGKEIFDTFGREPVAIARHNDYFGAQHVAVAGERKVAYSDGFVYVPGYKQPTWYAGGLTLPAQCIAGGLDSLYSQDREFEARINYLDNYLKERIDEGHEYAAIDIAGAVRIVTSGWSEFYRLPSGKTKTIEELGWTYAIKSPEEIERVKYNFKQYCNHLKNLPDLEIVGISEIYDLFSDQPMYISRGTLVKYADEVICEGGPILHNTYSPAEFVCGFAESILHAKQYSDIPDKVERRNVLGPRCKPISGIEIDVLSGDEVELLAGEVVKAVRKEGHLPGNVHVLGGRVGIGQFALIAARYYGALARNEKYEKVKVEQTERYPEIAYEIGTYVQRWIGDHWAFAPEFSYKKIAEHAMLQSWSLKPAWLNPSLCNATEGVREAV